MMKTVLMCLGLLAVASAFDYDVLVHNHQIIKTVNTNPKSTWTAGINKRFTNASLADVKALCGVKAQTNPNHEPLPLKQPEAILSQIAQVMPDSFDSRQQWSQCPSISLIRDQADCGSCWAFGAAEAMSDRTCIHTPGNPDVYLSAEDIMSCCSFFCGNGCDGGYPESAWSFWKSTGVVTGGLYGSKTGCLPYELPGCDHHEKGNLKPCPSGIAATPQCTEKCVNGDKTFAESKHFGASAYAVPSSVAEIQKEIMTNGPVEASFTVYGDFPTYRSGVYQHTTGNALGGHAIRILGWGVENGTPYWLVANSWNASWGDKGYFKILRGSNECGIESGVVAGMPKTS
jgi:cathepsin B